MTDNPSLPPGRRWCPLCGGDGAISEYDSLDVKGTRANWEELRPWLFEDGRVTSCPECRGVGHLARGLDWGVLVWVPLALFIIGFTAWAVWAKLSEAACC